MNPAIAPTAGQGDGQVHPASRHPAESISSNPDLATGHMEIINFAIGDDQYGVDIMSVREIREWSNVTHLPRQQDYVRGVLNLRGVVVPVIDLRCRFGQGLTECTATHIIIIVHLEGRQIGLLADHVLDIVSFDQNDIQPVPTVARLNRARFLAGLVSVEGTMIALVDLPHLLSEDAETNGPVTVLLDV